MPPVLAQDISRVDVSWHMLEVDCSGGNGFPGEMVGEGMVAFLEW